MPRRHPYKVGLVHEFLSTEANGLAVPESFIDRDVFTLCCHSADRTKKISNACMQNQTSLLDKRPLGRFPRPNGCTVGITQTIMNLTWTILLLEKASSSLVPEAQSFDFLESIQPIKAFRSSTNPPHFQKSSYIRTFTSDFADTEKLASFL